MANVIYDSNGEPINYTEKGYDPITQTSKKKNKETVLPVNPANVFGGRGNVLDVSGTTNENAASFNLRGVEEQHSISNEDYDSKYGTGPLKSWEDIQKNRIVSQGNFSKFGVAVLGGLAKGIGTALKDIGYIADWTTYAKTFGLMDMESQGTISNTTDYISEAITAGVDENLKMYEDESDQSISGMLTKWSTLSSVLDSALGFAIPGMAISKVGTLAAKTISGTGKLLKWGAAIKNLTRTEKLANNLIRAEVGLQHIQKTMPILSRIANAGGSALLQGYGEAMWEAKDAKTAFMDKFAVSVFTNEKNITDINNMGEVQAQKVFNWNLLKSALNIGMFDKMNRTLGKGALKIKPTLANKMWDMAKATPMETIEEAGQEMFKMEAEYEALKGYESINKNSDLIKNLKDSGKYVGNLNSDFSKRFAQMLSTNQVIVSGIIGAITGPIQAGITRGYGSVDRFKKEVKEYEKQQAFIKDRDAVYASKEKFMQEMEKSALANKLVDASFNMDNEKSKRLVEKQVYTQEIVEHLAKGTFEHLEKVAEEHKNTDDHMSNLSKYIKELKPLISKYQTYENSTEVVNVAAGIAINKGHIEAFEDQVLAINSIVKDRRTEEENDKLKDLEEGLVNLHSQLAKEQENFDNITSRKYQRKLYISNRIKDDMAKALQTIDSAVTLRDLNSLKIAIPGIEESQKFQDQMKKVLDGTAASSFKAIKDNAKLKKESIKKTAKKNKEAAEENPEIEIEKETQELDKEVKDIPQGLSPKTVRNNTVISLLAYDDEAFDEEDLDAVLKQVNEEYAKESAGLKDETAHSTVLKSVIDKTINDYVHKFRIDIVKKKDLVQKEGQAISTSIASSIASMDDGRKKGAALALEIEKIDQALSMGGISEQDAAEARIKRGKLDNLRMTIGTKQSEYLKNLKDVIERHFGKPIQEAFPDFNSFVKYITDMTTEEFAFTNFTLLKDIYLTAFPTAQLAETYAESMGYTTDYGVPEDMPTLNMNSIVQESMKETMGDSNKSLTNVVEENLSDGEQSVVRDGTSSLAHLSVSYHVVTDENENTVLIDDSDPVRNLSLVLSPEDYQGGEVLTMEIEHDYKKKIALRERDGYTLYQQVKHNFVNEDGSVKDIKIPEVAKAWNKFKKANGIVGDEVLPEDFIPIVIKDKDGNTLGYMHQPNWINNLNISPEEKTKQRAIMRSKRRTVIDSIAKDKTATGKIRKKVIYLNKIGRYMGFVMNYAEKKDKANLAVKEDVQLAVITLKGGLMSNISPKHIMNFGIVSDWPKGISLMLVPIGVNSMGETLYHGEPLYTTPLSQELSTIAMACIRAYTHSDKDGKLNTQGLSQKDVNLINDVITNYKTYHGINITTAAGLQVALERFMYVYKQKGAFDLNIKFSRTKDTSANTIFSINPDTGEIHFGMAQKKTINKESMSTEELVDMMENLEDLFNEGKFMFNVNAGMMNNNKKVSIPTVDENGNVKTIAMKYNTFVKNNTETFLRGDKLANGKYTYTLQNIVEYDVDGYSPSSANPTVKKVTVKTKKTPTKKEKALIEVDEESKNVNDTVAYVNEVLATLGKGIVITKSTPVKDITTALSSTKLGKALYTAIQSDDAEGARKVFITMESYKAIYPITQEEFFKVLPKDMQTLVEDVYEVEGVNIDKIKHALKSANPRSLIQNMIDAEGFNNINRC